MADKLYKARLLRGNDEVDLAWNIHKYSIVDDFITLDHARGRVFHKMAPGDTITFLEQYKQDEDH